MLALLQVYRTKSGIKLLIFALEQKLKVHWNGVQKTFLLSYYTSKSEQAENSLVLPINLNYIIFCYQRIWLIWPQKLLYVPLTYITPKTEFLTGLKFFHTILLLTQKFIYLNNLIKTIKKKQFCCYNIMH